MRDGVLIRYPGLSTVPGVTIPAKQGITGRVPADRDRLEEDSRVEFEVTRGPKGLAAINVTVI